MSSRTHTRSEPATALPSLFTAPAAIRAASIAISRRDETAEIAMVPLVILGPGGEFTRRYVADGRALRRLAAHPTRESSDADRPSTSPRPLGVRSLGAIARAAVHRAYAKFEAVALEIFTTPGPSIEGAAESAAEGAAISGASHPSNDPRSENDLFSLASRNSDSDPASASTSEHTHESHAQATSRSSSMRRLIQCSAGLHHRSASTMRWPSAASMS